MVLSNPAKPLKEEAYHLVDYHPYWLDKSNNVKNPKRDANTSRIMDLKAQVKGESLRFANQLCGEICSGVSICVVPSHDPAKVSSGIRNTAQELAKRKGRVDATGCLVRFKFVPKKSEGGERSMQVDLTSVEVVNKALIAGRSILLLDDVTTTGHSLAACRKLLLAAGAEEVQAFAVGKTTH